MNVLALIPAVTRDKAWIHDQLGGVLGQVADHVPEMAVTYRYLAGLAPHGASCDESDQLVRELEAADLVVIGAPIGHHPVTPALAEWSRRARASKGFGAPLYAMGLNPGLRAWFSQVIRADRTFRYTAQGPQGLLAGKKAIVLAAQMGPWNNTAITDHQVRCIDTQLRFMGIDEIATIASDCQTSPVGNPRRWQSRQGKARQGQALAA